MLFKQQLEHKITSSIFLSSGLFLVFNPIAAHAIDPLTVNCMGENVGTIEVFEDTNDPLVFAYFEHNQANFSEAANQCWGGHFNWFQIATPSMGVIPPGNVPIDPPTPFVDPLSGGNGGSGSGAVADTLPFYLNEKTGTGIDPKTLLTNQIMGRRLLYEDSPNGHPDGGMIEFETYLVSVPGEIGQMDKMTFHLLTGFKWKFTQVDSTTRTITNLMPITPDLPKINEILKKDYNFPNWTAIDINHHSTPEPTSTLSLLVLGALGAGSTLKRKQKPSK